MDHDYSIEYEDVFLRPLRRTDIEQLRIWRNDAANSRYIRKIPEITPEAQQKWFEDYLLDETTYTFAIECAGELVGSVALYDIDGGTAEFGRLMVGGSKGRGIGGKATDAALRVAFDVLGCSEVRAEVSVDNTAAIVIYSRVGFCITGRTFNEAAQMDEFLLRIDAPRFDALENVDLSREGEAM